MISLTPTPPYYTHHTKSTISHQPSHHHSRNPTNTKKTSLSHTATINNHQHPPNPPHAYPLPPFSVSTAMFVFMRIDRKWWMIKAVGTLSNTTRQGWVRVWFRERRVLAVMFFLSIIYFGDEKSGGKGCGMMSLCERSSLTPTFTSHTFTSIYSLYLNIIAHSLTYNQQPTTTQLSVPTSAPPTHILSTSKIMKPACLLHW